MKSLNSYLNQMHLPNFNGERTLDEFCDLNNIDINNITDDELALYQSLIYSGEKSHESRMFTIVEMLNSHSAELLAKRLENLLKTTVYKYGVHNINNCCIAFYLKNGDIVNKSSAANARLRDSYISKQIYDLLDFFNYYITRIEYEISSDNFLIIIEPKYTCEYHSKNNIYYHVTHKSKLQLILKQGLKPKVGKTIIHGGYRYFPEKLFLIPDCDSIDALKTELLKVIHDKRYRHDEYVILKIDGNNIYNNESSTQLGVFIDDYSKNAENVYTYEYIPKRAISVYYKLNELN